MADPVIALDRVSVRYATAPSPTLRDISFRVEPGEFVGIVGSTGSGKSTLLYLLAGVIPHYLGAELDGDVLIHGRRTQELSLARISERVGLVLQDPEAQLFNLLVRDELAWASRTAASRARKSPHAWPRRCRSSGSRGCRTASPMTSRAGRSSGWRWPRSTPSLPRSISSTTPRLSSTPSGPPR